MKQKKRKTPWKQALLLLVCTATLAVPILSGAGGTAFQDPVVAEAQGAYDDLAIDLAAATAFDDARSLARSDDAAAEQFQANVTEIMNGNRWGNVGLFVGPKGTSENSDVWSTFYSKVSMDARQIKTYDSWSDDAFSKYKAFGEAVQNLSADAKKSKGSSASIEEGLAAVANAGMSIANLGTTLIQRYNPAPVVLSLIDANELNTNPNNELVKMVNRNTNLHEMFTILGTTTGFGVPMSFLIMFLIAFLYVITSVLMTLINGRAAGENIRKAMVKALIGCVGIPLLAKGLDAGVDFLGMITTAAMQDPTRNYVEENLNLADWYACGFSMPSDVSLEIDDTGNFVFTRDDVRAINEFTYDRVVGDMSNGSAKDTAMKERMEQYYELSQANPMGVGFSEPITQDPDSSRYGKPWLTTNFYIILDNFGSCNEDGLMADVESSEDQHLADVGYFVQNGLLMNKSGGVYTVTGTGKSYGISPIAATNLMRTTFTGSSMTVNDVSTMGAVAFSIDNGVSTSGDTSTNMGFIAKFLATFAIVMAAVKGLVTIFTAGFGGLFSGSVKGVFGSSAGFGQALGGIIALVGGIFGIRLIMSVSYELLDELYGVVEGLISGTAAGGTDILEPFQDAIYGIPLFGPALSGMFKTVATLLCNLLCMLTLPKFGGIPVTLFCQYLAELPHRWAESAQQIENKFTGDFRGGSGHYGAGGMGSTSTMINQAANAGAAQGRAIAAGLGTAAGAIGAFGMTKIGQKWERSHSDESSEENNNNSMAEGTDGQDPNVNPESPDDKQNIQGEDATRQGAVEDNDDVQDNDVNETKVQGDSVTEGSTGDMVNGKEEVKENILDSVNEQSNDDEVVEDQDDVQETVSDEYDQTDSMSGEVQTTDTSTSETGTTDTEIQESADSETNTMAATDSAEELRSEQDNLADLDSRTENHTDASDKSMNPEGKDSGSGSESGKSGTSAGNADRAGSAAARNGSMAGSGKEGGEKTDKKGLTSTQRHNRRMRAIGKALQAAGGHTTAGAMVAGVAAGAVHVGGGLVGAQNVTQRGVNAVRSGRQRRRDIQAGLGPNYTQNQQRQQQANQAGRNAGGPGARPGTKAQGNNPQGQTRNDAQRRQQMMMEEQQRRAEEDAARKPRE